jgi:hypothetical protein
MSKCKGCLFWKWVKADRLYQAPGYHFCEKGEHRLLCKRRKEKMTKAEERALEAYPHYTAENLDDVIKARKFFAKGYEQAEKDLSWHPSTEHPPVDEEVIVLTDIITKGGFNAGFGKIAFGHIVDKNIAIDYDGWNIPGVRYWMPCPEIPKEK